jgi:O-phosphoseryl-tRNA(Cys) synthetase
MKISHPSGLGKCRFLFSLKIPALIREAKISDLRLPIGDCLLTTLVSIQKQIPLPLHLFSLDRTYRGQVSSSAKRIETLGRKVVF